MNTSVIRYVLGWILLVEALFMLLPCGVAVLYQEQVGWYFAGVCLAGLAVGLLLIRRKPENNIFYIKEGCVATALGWILLSVVGCLPFWLSGEIPSFTDALFETISGFTTTGASILSDVEALSYCMRFWRSFTHWIGGMGVLVFLLAVLQMPGGFHMNLMKAESPGPSVGKLRPKVRQTARILYLIYLGMTIIEVVLLLLGDMPLFDALTITFGSAGTGGFGIKNDSMMSYSPYLQWVVAIFMALFGVNFSFYYLLLLGKWRDAFKMEEVRGYFFIIGASIAIIMLNIGRTAMGLGDLLRHAAFQVSSIITTTGYATADFNLWPEASRSILVLLMFIGACAGSTGGGIKVSRILIMFKTAARELHAYVFPKSVQSIKMDDKTIDDDVIRGTHIFFFVFSVIFVASTFLLSLENHDMVTNFTAVAATINNIGPGLELVGPTGNFGLFTPLGKYVLMFDMLVGRLELFPMLVLFCPASWKGTFAHHRRLSARTARQN